MGGGNGPLLRGSTRVGLVAGASVCFLALVGIIERLVDLVLVGNITMSTLMIFLPPLMGGWVATRPRVVAGERRTAPPPLAVSAGGIQGLVTGLVVTVFVVVIEFVGVATVRQVFVSVSPELMAILRFHRGPILGTIVLVLGSALAGAFGAGVRVLPARTQRVVIAGVTAVVVAALLKRVVAPALIQLKLDTTWIYSPITLGLTWLGAIVVFVLAGVAVTARLGTRIHDVLRPDLSQETAKDPADPPEPGGSRMTKRGVMIVAWCVVAVVLMALPYLVGPVVSRILGSVGIFVLLGLGLNIVVGYAGLLDLGYVAFFAVGAYFTAVLTGGERLTFQGYAPPAFSVHLSFYVAVPIVVLIAAGIGVMIGAPVLRLRGDYLAIVTLGFGEIARVIFGSTWAQSLFGGANGMGNITDAPIPGLGTHFQSDPRHFYFLVLAFCLIAVFVSWRLQDSRIGRAWNAMREDEQVADAMGISTTRFKLLAFAMGGAIGSLGGALFAVSLGSLTIASFQILVSITALSVIILGGLGSIPGVVVGAIVLIGLPGVLTEFEDYRLLIYGAVLIAIMLLRPQGLVPNVRRSRELQEDERSQDQWAHHQSEGDAVDALEPRGGPVV
jgi:branched-chain amino acid transport system permease protein